MDDPMTRLIAQQELADVQYKYCRGLDRMDKPMVQAVWHPDGTADYGQYFRGTAADFIEWVWSYHASLWRHTHQFHNQLVEFSGRSNAVSEAYYTVMLREHLGGQRYVDFVFRNRYLDRWSHREGRWAIDHRQCVVELGDRHEHEIPAEVDGSAFPVTRDTRDPSYLLFTTTY
jgi:hypothetical protein